MHRCTWRRSAALALLLTATVLGAAGCDRRAGDPALPSTTPSTSPSTTLPPATPDMGASAASR